MAAIVSFSSSRGPLPVDDYKRYYSPKLTEAYRSAACKLAFQNCLAVWRKVGYNAKRFDRGSLDFLTSTWPASMARRTQVLIPITEEDNSPPKPLNRPKSKHPCIQLYYSRWLAPQQKSVQECMEICSEIFEVWMERNDERRSFSIETKYFLAVISSEKRRFPGEILLPFYWGIAGLVQVPIPYSRSAHRKLLQ